MNFRLLAEPGWVNAAIFVPFLCYSWWRRSRLSISRRHLLFTFLFAAAFGFAEGAVVVYLRASVGLLPGVAGTLADVQQQASEAYVQSFSLASFPPSLLTVEIFREAATIIMLLSTAALASSRMREFCGVFLWEFATWDIAYYASLWLLVRWPTSIKSLDVLFLIPSPWISQVWFPILVSALSLVAVAATRAESG